jgi:hypothetical protein
MLSLTIPAVMPHRRVDACAKHTHKNGLDATQMLFGKTTPAGRTTTNSKTQPLFFNSDKTNFANSFNVSNTP